MQEGEGVQELVPHHTLPVGRPAEREASQVEAALIRPAADGLAGCADAGVDAGGSGDAADANGDTSADADPR
jgi:hypothetical protein